MYAEGILEGYFYREVGDLTNFGDQLVKCQTSQVKYPTAYRFMSGYNDGSHGYARAYKTNDKRPEAHVYNSGYASGESKVKITAEILGGVRAKELEKHPEKTREKHGMWDAS